MIRHEELQMGRGPVIVWRAVRGADAPLASFCSWIVERRAEIDRVLIQSGGLLIRGFRALSDAGAFERLLLAAGSRLMEYVGGTSPRKMVGGRIYTATEVPGTYSIPLHQEMSYADSSPERIAFFCVQPAPRGGQTTVGDMRAITRSIDPAVLQRFKVRGGLQLRRNLPLPTHVEGRPGVPKPWTEVFASEDPQQAERIAHAHGWRAQWEPDGSMTLWQDRRPAMRRHAVTGEEVWFNQVHIFAPAAALAWARRDGRLDMARRLEHARHNYPNLLDCFVFADGGEVSDEDALHLYDVMEREAVPLNWEPGDLLILDNVLAAHGRLRYDGPRRLLTGLIGEVT